MQQVSKRPTRGSRKTRVGRVSIPDQVYHITTCTAERRSVFREFANARCVIAALRRQHDEGFASTLAFVVMPDHLHWLMQLGAAKALPLVVAAVKSESARYIRQASGDRYTVWQRGYFDRAMRRDEDLVAVARYIVANPLRAGLVASISEYPHWDACWM